MKGNAEGVSFNISNAANEYTLGKLEGVVVADGQLNVEFDAGTWRMGAIIITPEVEVDATFVSAEVEDVVMVAGTELVLPTTVKHIMSDNTVRELPVTWDASAVDTTTVGEYTVIGVSELTHNITFKVVVSENHIVSLGTVEGVSVEAGSSVVLPSQVEATYADGSVAMVDVAWESVDTTVEGVFTVKGMVAGFDGSVTIEVAVTRAPLYKFDFGIRTNAEEEGWTGITVGGSDLTVYGYSQEKGYGFADMDGTVLTAVIAGRHEGYEFEGRLPENVYLDFALPQGKQFLVDLPNGKYTVEVVSGSYYKSSVRGWVEGVRLNIGNDAGTYAIQTLEGIEVLDGQLNITFDSNNISRMNAIIITVEEIYEETVEVVEIKGLDPLTVFVGTMPVLPTVLEHVMSDETVVEAVVTWDTSALDVSVPGSYEVVGATELAEDIKLVINVVANGIVSVEKLGLVAVVQGQEVVLPATVEATFEDGTSKHVSVTWDEITSEYAGTFIVTGSVDGYGTVVTIEVLVMELVGGEDVEVEEGVEVNYSSDWGSGSAAQAVITNTTGLDFYTGWTIEFDCDREITSLWGAELVSVEKTADGFHYVVKNASWSPILLADQSVEFGFNTGATYGTTGDIKNLIFTNIEEREEKEDNSTTSFNFDYISDWGSGASAFINITNDTGVDFLDGWSFSFDFDRDITGFWDGNLSKDGNRYTVTNPAWNGIFMAGDTKTISFNVGSGSILDRVINVSWN